MSDKDFRGHPLLLYFGYTHCPDICPTTLTHLAAILRAVGESGKVLAAFITVDPKRDTLPVLKEYLSSFDGHIIGLWGSPTEIARVEKSFRVTAVKRPESGGDYSIDHTSLVYLLDKTGRFVGPFDVDESAQAATQQLGKYW